MNRIAFAIGGIAVALLYSVCAIAQDLRTKRCEIRPNCAVFLSESGKCPPEPAITGGTCQAGLLQGFVSRNLQNGPPLLRYQDGKLFGPFLSPINNGLPASKAFVLYEFDANGKYTGDGDGRYICNFAPNGTLMLDGGTLMNQACTRAVNWLGAQNVVGVITGGTTALLPTPPSPESDSSIAKAKAAEEERKRQDAAEIRAALGQLAQTLNAGGANQGQGVAQAQNQPSTPAPSGQSYGATQGTQQPKSYINEQTGEACVKTVGSDPTYPYQPSQTLGYVYLKNSCGRTFTITGTFKNGTVRTNGVQPYGKSHIVCERAKGECDGNISIGFQ